MTRTRIHEAATIAMDTVVSIQVVSDQEEQSVQPALDRALRWFATVERGNRGTNIHA